MTHQTPIYSGKVREIFSDGNRLIIAATDRLSAFDRMICDVPRKGAVLNLLSAWWFVKTAGIIPNHLIEVPDQNIMVVKKCAPIPLEIVVRGYITGSTDTSIWVQYLNGARDFGGLRLADGLRKNQALPDAIVTPTTKSHDHDRPITRSEILAAGILSAEEWDFIAAKAIALYTFGAAFALKKGLILVDTKYEFGFDEQHRITLIDEMHTPDSSRYWLAATYDQRIKENDEPDNFDKEFIRLWIKRHSNPYHDDVLPVIPDELINELSERYQTIYRMLTGNDVPPASPEPLENRIQSILQSSTNYGM
ncbi:phosphoribosylaminoimidazolesuccinocarboxamide synthase [Candidatus Uhrbacteria bacterium]|nr:phosphoribosylaminoimidazolesuccinocarboxamide synthase [Candidatus Uhrbacteria bacterium]